jgi:hypothetical protein
MMVATQLTTRTFAIQISEADVPLSIVTMNVISNLITGIRVGASGNRRTVLVFAEQVQSSWPQCFLVTTRCVYCYLLKKIFLSSAWQGQKGGWRKQHSRYVLRHQFVFVLAILIDFSIMISNL